MKTKLITALKASAIALDNGTFNYDWHRRESCNCGILASALTGKSLEQLKVELPGEGRETWGKMIGRHCPITGISENAIFKTLQLAGLTALDLNQLEELSNPKIRNKMFETSNFQETKVVRSGLLLRKKKVQVKVPNDRVPYDHKCPVAAYMRAWAEILIEEGREDLPEKSETKTELASV